MAGRLSGKVCIITGSGGSMGRAAAILFASEGARVIGCDVNAESALETLKLVKDSQGDMASMQPCDLTDAKQCQALVDFAVSTYGRIDVLFNNAAMAYFGWIDQMADEDWYKTITQELHLVFLLTKERLCWDGRAVRKRSPMPRFSSLPMKALTRPAPTCSSTVA